MKRIKIFSLALVVTLSFSVSSCFQDLDLAPRYGVNAASVYEDPENYVNVLAKLYGGLAMSGNQGPAGDPDISGIDEGFSQYVRVLWNLQELPTDEAICGWADPGIPELNTNDWVSTNSFTTAMYNRVFFQVALCNEFIRETTEKKLNDRDFSQADIDRITQYRYEARFLRALSYYHALDLFGNVPFITDGNKIGSDFPEQIQKTALFEYVESELLAIEGLLIDPVVGFDATYYGRANKAAAWSLLAKLYLNAEVYTGTARWADCITYCNKVITQGGYSLDDEYTDLFLADNHTSPEVIFPIPFDGLKTQTYGGTTFLTHATVGGSMKAADFGINSGWGGYRTTKGLVQKFTDTNDNRYLFYTQGQSLEIADVGTFTDGYAIAKWKNVDQNGVKGSDPTGNFVDIDYPMFRLADVYLMYAEAAVKGGGNTGTGLGYINELRDRAGIANLGSYTAMDVLDERARELYWEATRRTDLIRYGLYAGGTYNWPWKGGVDVGTSIAQFRKLYPLAQSDVVANPNLTQNDGY